MALVKGTRPTFQGVTVTPVTKLPNSAQGTGNSIPAHASVVVLGANVNNADDFTVLPSLAHVPDGHVITLLAGTAANSELRTPSASGEKINNEDCDGTKEALLTAGNVYTVVKLDNTRGWMLEGRTAIGAFQTAIVPD